MTIVISTIIISLLVAFILGALLGVFSKIFHVEVDEKEAAILKVLPNGNCGGCGYAGCAAYAKAVAEGTAPANACTAGGPSVAKALGEILGQTVEAQSYFAVVACQGTKDNACSRGNYHGVESCAAAAIAINGTKLCGFGCIGIGDCVKVCKFDAIKLENGIPVIDKEKCTGCGACARECPRKLIKKIPEGQKAPLPLCQNRSENKQAVLKDCKVSCIKCSKCVRDCPEQAIVMDKGIPVIDSSKCTGCGTCVSSCPRKVIKFI